MVITESHKALKKSPPQLGHWLQSHRDYQDSTAVGFFIATG